MSTNTMTDTSLYREYQKYHVALDCIIFGFDQNELKLLLIKRGFEPEKGNWSLMGGFLQASENLDQAAERILHKLTGLTDIFMEQLFTYGSVDRDPVDRTISVAYFALIKTDQYDPNLALSHDAEWFSIDNIPKLIFDHAEMVSKALETLKQKSKTQPIGFELLPEKFSVPQLRKLYEAINQKPLDHRNFSKKIKAMPWIVRLDEKDKAGSKKGAFLYTFNKEEYQKLKSEGLSFSL